MKKTKKNEETILIIDDDPKTLALLNDYLSKKGYQVTLLEDGERALAQVPRLKPALIFLDLHLPGSDGFTIAARLKEKAETRDIPIIFLTVSSETADKVKGFALGAVDFITKPVNLEEVAARVKTHITIHNLQNSVEEKNRRLQQEIAERERTAAALQDSEAHFRRLVDLNPGPIVVHCEGKVVYVNEACLKMMAAASAQEALGKPVLDFVHPDYREIVIKRIRQTQENGKEIATLEEKFIRFDGEIIDVEVTGIPTTYEGKPATQLILNDITARKRIEEERRKLTHQLSERVKELDCLYGISALVEEHKGLDEILQGTVELIPHGWQYPEITRARITAAEQKFTTKKFKESPWKQNCPIIVNNKTVGAVEVFYIEEKPECFEGPFVKEERSLLNAICERLGRVIERMRAEDQVRAALAEKGVLLKEIHHRVKNNLQLINSLLSLQSRKINNEEISSVLVDIKNRVNSIALIHEKLYQADDLSSIDFAEYIRILTDHLAHSYPDRVSAVKLDIDQEKVFLEVSKAIPCALIVNELVTNAMKYAFPAGRRGEINVSLITAGSDKISLTVADKGVGIPGSIDINNPETLGMQIVQALVKQLKGTIKVDRKQGTKITIEFQVKRQ